MYDEQRYQKPSNISHLVMHVDGSDGVRYYLCYDDNENVIVRGGDSKFMATLDYVVANGLLHAMTDSGKILDHQMPADAWGQFRNYCGIYGEVSQDKYTAWLES